MSSFGSAWHEWLFFSGRSVKYTMNWICLLHNEFLILLKIGIIRSFRCISLFREKLYNQEFLLTNREQVPESKENYKQKQLVCHLLHKINQISFVHRIYIIAVVVVIAVSFLSWVQKNCSSLKADVILGLQQHVSTRIEISWLEQRNRITSISVPLHDTAAWVKIKQRKDKTRIKSRKKKQKSMTK